MKPSKETVGVFFGFTQSALWGIFPVLVHYGVGQIPPLTFAALSTLIAAIPSFFWMLATRRWQEFGYHRIYFPLCIVALCSTILPYSILFFGASMTSGMNTSMLLTTEIIFLMIFSHVIGEKTTPLKVIGATCVFAGAVIMMYQGGTSFRFGDLLVIVSTAPYFFGNFYGKKLLNIISPQSIMVFRFFAGGCILFLIARLFEGEVALMPLVQAYAPLFLINGVILLGIGKILWYESFKRLDISKAVLIAMTSPLFSIALLVFLGEKITMQQWIGSSIMILGVFATIRRPSVDPMITKYSHV